ncbi:hypothetical protein ZWY2020_017742 [Hordeum vulgare]|nr:hypothetical protein ZWY2020_017742 [Hordeum vulgare]
MASFLQLRLPPRRRLPELAGEHHGSRLALQQLLAVLPPSAQQQQQRRRSRRRTPRPSRPRSWRTCSTPPRLLPDCQKASPKPCRFRGPLQHAGEVQEELARPIQEATEFFKSVETQLDSITFTDSTNCEGAGSSEDDLDASCVEEIDPSAEDKELKHQLLRKYGGMWEPPAGVLQAAEEGKLPRRPGRSCCTVADAGGGAYVQETEKIALAESTGWTRSRSTTGSSTRGSGTGSRRRGHAFSVMDGGGRELPPLQGPAMYMDRAPFMVDGMYRLGLDLEASLPS